MPKIDDGGPAFPAPSVYLDENVCPRQVEQGELGMTLRDWFAGQVLVGLAANGAVKIPYQAGFERGPADAAALAYRFADAMIAARDNRSV